MTFSKLPKISNADREVAAYIFPNDGRFDAEKALAIVFDRLTDFKEQINRFFFQLYGEHPVDGGMRVYNDLGIEVTSLDVAQGVQIILVLSRGEEFKPLDIKGKLMNDVSELGWVREDNLSEFVLGLTKAIQLDAMDGADDDAISLSHMNSPKVDMVMALLGYAKKDRLSAQNSPADSAASPEYLPLRQSDDDYGAPPHSDDLVPVPGAQAVRTESVSAGLQERVLGAMPRIAVDKDLVTVQPTLIATMDSRRPPDLDHDLIRRAEGMHIGSRSPLTDPNSMPDDEDDSGSDDMGSLGRGGTVRHFDAEEQKQALRAERHRKADSRYRNRFAGAVSSLQNLLVTKAPRTAGRAALFEHATLYLQASKEANRKIASENAQLYQELERERQALLTSHRLLQQQRVGVCILELWGATAQTRVKRTGDGRLLRTWPDEDRKPFIAHLVYWDHVMELMTGFSALDALGRPLSEVLGFHHIEYVRRCHVSTLLHLPWPWRKDLFPYKHPAIIVRKDGKMLVAMAYFEPIRSPNAWFYNHVIVWYNQFRPFDPVKIE